MVVPLFLAIPDVNGVPLDILAPVKLPLLFEMVGEVNPLSAAPFNVTVPVNVLFPPVKILVWSEATMIPFIGTNASLDSTQEDTSLNEAPAKVLLTLTLICTYWAVLVLPANDCTDILFVVVVTLPPQSVYVPPASFERPWYS